MQIFVPIAEKEKKIVRNLIEKIQVRYSNPLIHHPLYYQEDCLFIPSKHYI